MVLGTYPPYPDPISYSLKPWNLTHRQKHNTTYVYTIVLPFAEKWRARTNDGRRTTTERSGFTEPLRRIDSRLAPKRSFYRPPQVYQLSLGSRQAPHCTALHNR
ncbi:hypothetical protein evm_000043 [Chilo suppressalis]|nr:hypothetical protein evm_000043 [Chilo suppressalis]